MTVMQTLNTRYQYLPTDDRRAAVKAAVKMLKEGLLSDLIEVPASLRRGYTRGGPRALAFKKDALGQAQAEPAVVSNAVDIGRFAQDVAAADELREILQELEHLVYALEGSVMVLDKQGYDDATGVYKGAETGARLGQPAAARVHGRLATHHARPRRAKPAVPDPKTATDGEAPEDDDLQPPAFEE